MDKQVQLLKDYSRPIVHMRHQFESKRFGLVFGAGISRSFQLPGWGDFVKNIAADREVQGKNILERFTARDSLPFKTELLFQHFRKLQAKRGPATNIHSLEFDNRTFAKWIKICAKHLYKNAPANFSATLKNHPYLSALLPIIQGTQLAITYNFDDYLERALMEGRPPDDKTLGYETVTNPRMQFKRFNSVVYHPNGVIPSELMELPSDHFVLSESSFAKQMVGPLAVDTSFLVNHFCKNTCLLIGSSLEDETLRNVLVQSAAANPGNCHYYIHFLSNSRMPPAADIEAIRMANFNVFNVITLFLGDSSIAALAKLINHQAVDDAALSDLAGRAGTDLAFRFYITGTLGAGKSSVTNQLRNLRVMDEWLEPRPSILAKSWRKLTPGEKKRTDKWIVRQFKLKNDNLRHAQAGIVVVDRPPLDPLVFTPSTEWHLKANLLLSQICEVNTWKVANGTVILLEGEPNELAVRVLFTGQDGYSSELLAEMQRNLDKIYAGIGVVHLNTRGMNIHEVTKRVTEIIHFRPYQTFDLDARLRKLMNKRG